MTDLYAKDQSTLPEVKSVAVIGFGPLGAVMAKSLLEEKYFDCVQVYERSYQGGGTWNYYKPLLKEKPKIDVPSNSLFSRIEPQQIKDSGNVRCIFPSAGYKCLTTNIPRSIIGYSGAEFPPDTPVFPSRQQFLEYLHAYSEPIKQHVKFNTEIVKVEYNDQTAKYSLYAQDLIANSTAVEEYDAVVVASGFFNYPYVPNIPGLASWHELYPDDITHAREYDSYEEYKDVKGKILIVGCGPSGIDITDELCSNLHKPVYRSERSDHYMVEESPLLKKLGQIKQFVPESRSVEFTDGTVLEDVDRVIICTGYLKGMPFLPREPIGEGNRILTNLVTDGKCVHNLYNHLIPIGLPTFALMGLTKMVALVRLGETQAAWIAKLWRGSIPLPSVETQWKYHQWFIDANGPSNYHYLGFPRDVQYSKRLQREIKKAGDGGIIPREWTHDDIRARSALEEIKRAYWKKTVEENYLPTSIDELDVEWPEADLCIKCPDFAP